MKNIKSLFFLGYLMLMAFVIISCGTEDEDVPPAQNADPIITDMGTPTGNPTSASIGVSGGTLQSADGKLSVIIPAGALSATTTVNVQPITNEGPLGLGLAYRLQPEGVTFAKPVTLQFHYDNQLLKETPEAFLWIITQTDNGSWNAMLKSHVDEVAKTVTVEATHFSDWSLAKFIDLSLNPSSKTIKQGQSVQLQLAGFLRDKALTDDDELAPLTPITSTDDALTPLIPIERLVMNFKIKAWTLNGVNAPVSNSNGSLDATSNSATYTAPNKRPAVNPVAVSVQLESNNKGGTNSSYMLTSSISVVNEDLYLLIKIDGQPYEYYQYGLNGAIPPDPNNFSIANCTISDNTLAVFGTTTGPNNELKNLFGMELHNPTEGDHSLSCFHTDGDDDMGFMPVSLTAYENERSIRTKAGTDCIIENVCGDISVTLLVFENKFLGVVQGYFSGTIYEDKQGYSKDCISSDAHTIEGEFRLNLVK